MGDITLTTNIEEVFKAFEAFEASIYRRVAPRSANRLIRMADVAGRRKISELYKISSRKIAGDRFMEIRDATESELRAIVQSVGAGLPLILFNPRPGQVAKKGRKPGTGVTVTIMGRNVFIPHAFIQKMPTGSNQAGKLHVMARGSYGGKGLGRASGKVFGRFVFGIDRLPINVLYTFGMAETLANPQVIDAMIDRVEEATPSVIKRELAAAGRGF